jgi:hypothetical protein
MNDLIHGGQGKSAEEVWDSAVIAVLCGGGVILSLIGLWLLV